MILPSNEKLTKEQIIEKNQAGKFLKMGIFRLSVHADDKFIKFLMDGIKNNSDTMNSKYPEFWDKEMIYSKLTLTYLGIRAFLALEAPEPLKSINLDWLNNLSYTINGKPMRR